MVEGQEKLLKAATNAAAMIGAVYEWLDRVKEAGGATSISGISTCHAMITSLEKNRARVETLVRVPLREAIAEAGNVVR